MPVLESVAGEWRSQDNRFQATDSKIAPLPNGNFVVVWLKMDGGQNDIVYHILDKGGRPLDESKVANTPNVLNESKRKFDPNVVVLDDGKFVISWPQQFSGADGNGNGIISRVFDEGGNPIGPSFSSGTWSVGSNLLFADDGHLASAGANEFWIVSQTWIGNQGFNIFRQKFDTSGDPLTPMVRVNEELAGLSSIFKSAYQPEFVQLENGNYLVAWTWYSNAQFVDVRARLFDSEFNPLTGDFEVTSRQDTSVPFPDYRLTALADGAFAIVSSATQPSASGLERIIELNIFNADGTVRADSVIVTTFPNGGPGSSGLASPTIATLANGQLVIGWLAPGDTKVPQGAIFDADGNAVITGFDLGDSPIQRGLELITKPDGSIAMTYTGPDGLGFSQMSVKANVLERISNPTVTNSDDFVLYAANHSPAVNGLRGNDTIVGNTGNNTILGDIGDDALYGNAGNDTITGGRGNDMLYGGDGDDVFRFTTGDGQDFIDGGTGFDTLTALANNARLSFGSITGIELITAAGFSNVNLVGSVGNDIMDLTGATLDGIGYIDAGNGNDIIIGTAGDDVIRAGNGTDRLTGGDGNDRFVFQRLSDGQASTIDIITDFVQGSDIIDLSGVDANSTLNGNQAFTFIGGDAFSGVAGELRVLRAKVSGNTVLQGDTNGDGVFDFFVQLTGLYTLTTGDLVL